MWAEKKRKWPHEWLEGVLGVSGLAPSTHISQINQKVIKGYISLTYSEKVWLKSKETTRTSTLNRGKNIDLYMDICNHILLSSLKG
jgi:hypothetical protein